MQRPNSDIKQYVDTLHAILAHKIEMIEKLKNRVEEFSSYLEEEERLSA